MPPKKFYKKFAKLSTGYKAGSKISTSSHVNATFLVIVESPSKCNKIEHYLGPDYQCIASKGHIREINGLKNIDTKHNFEPTFDIIPEKGGHVQGMREIINSFKKQNIILATDDDREGEGIAWHICEVFGLSVETTQRIVFHEITQAAILAAIRTPRTIDMNLVAAQKARQVLDMVVGYKISPLLWRIISSGKASSLSAGRCQSPALRLVYDNEKERGQNETTMCYRTVGKFFSRNLAFELDHEFVDPPSVETFLEKSKTHNHVFEMGVLRESTKNAPKPFNTSRLLQVSSNVLGNSPKMTMQLCQSLYQNGFITYMRTDSTKYAGPFLETARKYIAGQYGETYPGSFDGITNYDKENPHEAIRCTDIHLRVLPENANPKEATMYRLIWRNTVESCMAAAKYNVHPLSISAPDITIHPLLDISSNETKKKGSTSKKQSPSQSPKYIHHLEIPTFLGWKIVTEKSGPEVDEATGLLFYLKNLSPEIRNRVPYQSIESTVVVHNKHSHYTEASLIQKLEDLGIGRPSTFALLVETIQEREYVKCTEVKGSSVQCVEFCLKDQILDKKVLDKVFGQEKNKLVIQPTGMICIEFLVQHFDKLFSYDYTRGMELELDRISTPPSNQETDPWYEICRKCYLDITERSKTLNLSKTVYRLDDQHELTFQKFGASVKKTEEDGSIKYLPVKKELVLDMEKVRAGEYKIEELVAYETDCLGMYQGHELFLKSGRFGPYLAWGENKQSLKTHPFSLDGITMETAVSFLDTISGKIFEKTDGDGVRKPTLPKDVLRIINTDLSVRKGRFGPYLYYKTADMKKPEFIALRKCPHNAMNCDSEEIMEWIGSR